MNDDDDLDAVHLPFSELGNYVFGQRVDRRATLPVVAPGASVAMKALKFFTGRRRVPDQLSELTQEPEKELDSGPAPQSQIPCPPTTQVEC